MATEKAPPTVADYLTLALSPALIVTLVVSLVFFLVEVLYVGDYSERLNWILFFFVVATVLICRIALHPAVSSRAALYGVALAIPTFLGMQMFVEYPEGPLATLSWGINLLLMAVVWWSAHKLTRDCTHIEDDPDAAEEGLLQAAGLADPALQDMDKSAEEPRTLWQRFQDYRQRQKKKRTPGVWVVYFSLAALPLFGLGQALIPVEEEARRRYVFWLMVLYVGSGLGLLLTTCFLGLRRYLRQRQVKMTTAMTAVWLAMASGVVLALLTVAALLPRPQAEYSVLEAAGITSPKQKASPISVMGDSPGKGEGQPGSQGPKGGEQPGSPSGQGGKPVQGQPNSTDPKANPGNSGSKDGQGGKNGNNGGNQQGNQTNSQGQPNSKPGQGQDQSSGPKSTGQQGKPNQSGSSSTDPKKAENQGQAGSKPPENGNNSGQAQQPSSSNPLNSLMNLMAAFGPVLKWIVFAVLALVVLFVIGRALLKFLANFSTWARDLLAWWRSLFAGWGRAADDGEEDGERTDPAARPRPFDDFANPFADGRAGQWSADKLVRYSFAALEAWAFERDVARRPDETPLEFADRLGEEVPALENDVRRLAGLYARSLYARGSLPAQSRGDRAEILDSAGSRGGPTAFGLKEFLKKSRFRGRDSVGRVSV